MRAWTEETYGIPPYQEVGSFGNYKFKVTDSSAAIFEMGDLIFNDDKSEKPVGIHRNIGKKPVFTAGNSDGDYEMLHTLPSAIQKAWVSLFTILIR